MEPSITEQLRQAREVVLSNPNNYPAILPSILPIIGTAADIELRRWGAEFLAETFASPLLPADQKQQLSLLVLDRLREFLDQPGEDVAVVKAIVQTAASIYPLLFRYIISNPHDNANWQKMAQVKSNILRRMDTAPPGVRICCIKFVQRVVQTQTPGLIADPRRPEHNEISLALVPRDHPLIPPPNLEAEASGLLDRLLSILQDEISDALLVTATLNSLGSLIRTRASVANKIVSTVLNFNPLKLANSPMTPKSKVMIKSMERTVRALLINVVKKNPNHPLAPRIQQHVDRLHHTRLEIFDETTRKRPAPIEPTDGLDLAKRQRLGADVHASTPPDALPLGPGPVSYAQLYTLTQDEGSRNFDVQAIPIDLLVRILVPILGSLDKPQLDNAINAVRARYLSLSRTQPRSALDASAAATQRAPVVDEDDDYEPVFQPTEDTEQIINRLDSAFADASALGRQPDVALGTFNLAPPPALTEQETVEYSKGTINRVFGIMSALDDSGRGKTQKHGFNRLAASGYDRDAWITMITRLATRASAGLEDESVVKKEEGAEIVPARKGGAFSISNAIRDALYLYVLEDFRRRIDVAVSWLCEEWYNDRLQADLAATEGSVMHYEKWALKVLDGILPYLDAKDKVLIRFLSEVPELIPAMLDRVKGLARDPERIALAVNAIHYLILMRPPVRDQCIDAVEDLWRNYDGAKGLTTKLLTKWRPHVLQEAANGAAAPPPSNEVVVVKTE
ncbi:mrna cleavage and polyadenylation specificity factor complex subunit [Diplodia corticola]|uniref:Mrna cleavage and polyadenylation specificity factor complex subunit n=1 Tax=Diplodia corticola TaxID=236234 RepID=A0A1J9QP43_9PEZI|nr:mrna cleavage and polyadenylation specificity factor complex subunit [Diplodia corticola]OJD29818.1 mrna cleavage and polyadenylation specificity factor complex subunit [Diplodia corticola]